MNHSKHFPTGNTVPFIRAAAAVIALLVALPGGTVLACSTPVFRYALERWGAQSYDDVYLLAVFHKGELKPEEKKIIDWLKETQWPEKTILNLAVETVDVGGEMPEPIQKIWKAQKEPRLPWLVLRYPLRPSIQMEIETDAWSGPLQGDIIKKMVDSPLRQKIAKKILDGDAAVWILLESGNRDKDDAAAKLLEESLKKMEKLLEIPKPPPGLADAGWGPEPSPEGFPELKVAFSVVHLSRTDPAEEFLRKLLLQVEKDLEKEYSGEPITFPVFGRGRALWALVGKGINEENIAEACSYITGMCSCEIKWQNPGIDILFWKDWDAYFMGQPSETAPLANLIMPPVEKEKPSLPEAAPAEKVEAGEVSRETPEKPETPAAGEDSRGGSLLRNTLIAVGALFAGILTLTMVFTRRSSRS